MTTQKRGPLKRPGFTLLAVQCAAIFVAATLIALGVLGFVPGVTTNLDDLHWFGHQSQTELFGVFQVSVLHNLFHIAMGVTGLALSRSYARSRAFLLGGGVVFLGLWVHGLFVGHNSPANLLPVNGADTWLHLGLGVTMVILALTLAGVRVPTGAGGEELPTVME